jgi:hypothetical protein
MTPAKFPGPALRLSTRRRPRPVAAAARDFRSHYLRVRVSTEYYRRRATGLPVTVTTAGHGRRRVPVTVLSLPVTTVSHGPCRQSDSAWQCPIRRSDSESEAAHCCGTGSRTGSSRQIMVQSTESRPAFCTILGNLSLVTEKK